MRSEIARALELTRFPVPDDTNTPKTRYKKRAWFRRRRSHWPTPINCIAETKTRVRRICRENGVNEKLGYQSPADLVERYPQFLEQSFFFEREIGDALRYLGVTMEGTQYRNSL